MTTLDTSMTELEELYDATRYDKFRTFISKVKVLQTAGQLSDFSLATRLGAIVENESEECRSILLKADRLSDTERERLSRAASLTAYCILLLCKTRSKIEIRNKTLCLLEYLSCLQSGDHKLLEVAARVCSCRMESPGYTLSHLETPNNINIIAHSLSKYAKFDENDKLSPFSYDSAGSIMIKDGVISLSSAHSWEARVKSFSSHGGCLEISTRNVRDERLKLSETDEVEPLENFAKTFLLSQSRTSRSREGKPQQLERGKKYTVVLIPPKSGEDQSILYCKPLEVDFPGRCLVKSEELVKGLHTRHIIEYIYDDDCVEGAELIDEVLDSEGNKIPVFSIRDAYMKYAKSVADNDCTQRRVYKARVVDFFKGETPDKDRVILLSDKGYGGLMVDDRSLETGQGIIVYTQNTIGTTKPLFINMARPNFDYSEVPVEFSKDDALLDFMVSKEEALSRLENARKDDSRVNLCKEIASRLATMLLHSVEERSVDRYRDQLCSAFLFNIAGEDSLRDFALERSEYLKCCLRVAEGLPVSAPQENHSLSGREKQLVGILAALGVTRDVCSAAALIRQMDSGADRELASLFMAHTLSVINRDDLDSSQENLRRRICEKLGVGDHVKGAVHKGGGKYGKGELENVEFKSSYVFHNKDGKADLFLQGRGQVLEAVCGFMNNRGGTVYVGVNDCGDPLVSDKYGLNADIAWFRSNFKTVNQQRYKQLGHNVPQPENLDSYCRFLNNEVELYFKPTLRGCLSISPTEDMDAIRITVRESEYEIAKLYTDNSWEDGCAYVRVGEETRPMSRHEQEQRLMKLRSVGKVEQFILTLTDAIDRKQKVILRNYASSNSNSVSDRFVVPINLVYNNENLWAYDIEKKECREFRLSRIGDIKVEDSVYSHSFDKGEADVFRWVNPKVNYHIKLKMSISALNQLREEYSNAKNLPETELYRASPERWILDTRLHGLDAVKSFYLGLADQIEIMDTEDSAALKQVIRDFRDKHLQI